MAIKKIKLVKVNPDTYLGKITDYNVKTSERTGKTYLNLYLTIYVDEEQEVEVQKSYCLDIGRNLHIMRLMKAVGGLKKGGEADFDKLQEYYLWVDVSYDQNGQLTVDKLTVAKEEELEEPDIESEFEEEE